MRRNWGILLAVVLCVFAGSASAAPIVGLYRSTELGGAVIDGRWSESYPGGAPGQIGNAIHAASWDGSNLATMWELSGPAINATPTVIYDDTVGGTGSVIYRTTYAGGTMSLKNTGPWWDAGDAGTEYVVDIDGYTHKTTFEYMDGDLIYEYSEVRFGGSIQGYPNRRLRFLVAVAVPLGEGSPLPSNFPDWVPQTAQSGHWGICQKIRMEIVPEPATAGVLVLGGIFVVLRRRR